MSFVRASYRIEVVRGSAYATLVQADNPAGFWRLNDLEGYAQAVLSDAPVGYWRLSGNSNDSSTGAHNGIDHGTITYGQSGPLSDGSTAALFNGSTGYSTIAVDPLASATAATIEGWVNHNGVAWSATHEMLTGDGDSLGLYISVNNGFSFGSLVIGGTQRTLSASAVPTSGWHHIVLTWTSGDNMRLYINGVLIATSGATYSGALPATTSREIGAFGGGSLRMNGSLGQIAVYTYALSAQQVANHYALRTSTISTVAAATVADLSGNGYTGTVVKAVTLGQSTPQPDGATGALFDGASGKVTASASALNLTAGPLSVEAWVKYGASSSDAGIAGTSAANGYQLNWHLGGNAYFYIGDGAHFAAAAVSQTGWHHLVGTWDGTTGANGIKLYIDGVLAAQGTAAVTTLSATGFAIGTSATYFNGSLEGVAVYAVALSATQVLNHYLSGFWSSLGTDVCSEPGPHFVRGCQQNGPMDHVAGIGTLDFEVYNDPRHGLQGRYSPNHANCLSGWARGIPVRVVSTYQSIALGDTTAQDRVLWTGKITSIVPTAGKYRDQRVAVSAQDAMGDLAAADVKEIAPQIDQSEAALIQVVIAALPAAAQPPAVSLDPGLDTFRYAFDDVGPGAKALSLLTDVVLSAYGWLYPMRDGTPRYENRHTRALRTSQFTFTDATHDDVHVPSDLANIYNRVQLTIHPRTIDAAATTVLCAATGVLEVPPGQTIQVWDTYRDPTNTLKLIGGTDFVDPVVAGVDYVANALSDGSGGDLTASVAVAVTPFASTVKFAVTNNHPSATAFLTTRQLRGRGIYDNAPQTFEKYIPMSYGDRPLPIDLAYLSDGPTAEAFADWIATLFSVQANQADDLIFNPQRSDALMTQALTRELGDLVTETETMTGLSSKLFAIVGMDYTIEPGQVLTVRDIIAFAGDGATFIFDDPDHGQFDDAESLLVYA